MTVENDEKPSEKNVSPCNTHHAIPNSKLSVISVVCRICYDNDKGEDLIAPCCCKGTVAFVHRTCLETWLAESNSTTCELCHHTFKTERTPRYTSSVSIWRWLIRGRRGFGGGDFLSCAVLTPLAVIITYICLYSAEYYSQKKFVNVPAARWTSISLLFMIAVMLLGYYMWVYSVIRIHARMWYNWWQRSCDVRYIASSNMTIFNTRRDVIVNVPNNTPIPQNANREIETTVVIEENKSTKEEEEQDNKAGALEEEIGGAGEQSTSVILIEDETEPHTSSHESITDLK